jgi:hypothetical protein
MLLVGQVRTSPVDRGPTAPDRASDDERLMAKIEVSLHGKKHGKSPKSQ